MSTQKPQLPIQGALGVPPPGAPHEVSAPLQPEMLSEMKHKAAANEMSLKPLPPLPKGAPTLAELKGAVKAVGAAMADPLGAQEGQTPKGAVPIMKDPGGPRGVSLKPTPAAIIAVAEAAEAGAMGDPPPPQSPDGLNEPEPQDSKVDVSGVEALISEVQPHEPFYPAGSETDSPSKGMPKPQVSGKEITGGWGEAGGGQYYALDGSELRTVILALMGDLKARLDTDLRFSLALTYPQVRCRVMIQIDGAVAEAAINDAKFDLEEARILHLVATVTDTDQTPADMIRDDHQITKPFKHLVKTGVGKSFADVEVTR